MHPIRSIRVLVIILVIHQTALNAQWIKTNGPYGGNITCFAVSGSYLLAGAILGGVYRSTDNGVSWTESDTGLTNKWVLSLAASGSYVFTGTTGGIFRSADNGATWTEVSTGLPAGSVKFLTFLDTDILAGTSAGVFRSTNNGENWTDVSTGMIWNYTYTLAVKDTNIFAGTAQGIYRSSRNNINWKACGLSSLNVFSILVSGSNIFAGTDGGIFLTTDRGEHWTVVNSDLNYSFVYSLVSLGSYIFAGDNINGIIRTSNNGGTWVPVNDGISNTRINFIGINGSTLFAGVQGGDGIYRSSNNGEKWTKSNEGLNNTIINSLIVKPVESGSSILFAGTTYGVFRSDDEGEKWTQVNSGLTKDYVYSLAVSGKRLFAGTSDGIFSSDNYGTSWTSISTGLTNMKVSAVTAAITRTGDTSIFAGTDGGGVFRSQNNGSTNWTEVNNGIKRKYINFLATSDTNIFAGGTGIFRSTNNGEKWSAADTGLTFSSVYTLAVSTDKKAMFAGTYTGGAFISTNNGSKWTQIRSGLPGYPTIRSFAFSGNYVFAALTDWGVFSSKNNGSYWNDFNTDLGHTDLQSIIVSDEHLFVGTRGGGVWKRPLSDIVTSVETPQGNFPTYIYLEQNYPNPFNSTTAFRFSISAASFVSLRIFNALGAEVATLLHAELPAGTYTQYWNARNMADGIYFYRLQAGVQSLTKKLILSK